MVNGNKTLKSEDLAASISQIVANNNDSNVCNSDDINDNLSQSSNIPNGMNLVGINFIVIL